ncbi:hypothetical protein [Comamonas thiooxydans]|uniref:hypothetical protein n=1 Tax=Comamonas thiooxydans TaxID=363952 RepID=UPI0013DAE8B7|nr:hypothetical protein [Comamonas thiooxydans]
MKKIGKKKTRRMSIPLGVKILFIIFLIMLNFVLLYDYISIAKIKIIGNKLIRNYLVMHEIKKLDAMINSDEKVKFHKDEK